MVKCKRCSKDFESRYKKQIYCSKDCKEMFFKEQYTPSEYKSKEKIKCKYCTKTFEKKHPSRKYCSNECSTKAHESRYTKTSTWGKQECAICKQEFDLPHPNAKYCSKECQTKQNKIKQKEKTEKDCWLCNTKFTGRSNQKFCSPACRNKATEPRTQFAIFNRDKFKCIYCGRSPLNDQDVELTISHIRPWSSSKDDKADNVATCCKECSKEKTSTFIREESYVLDVIDKRNKKCGISPATIVKDTLKSS